MRLKRWVDRWNAYWYPTTSTLNLGLCRILAVAAQLFLFRPRLDYQIDLLEKNSAFIDPQPIIRAITAVVSREVFFTRPVFTALYCLFVVAGIAALIGIFTRASLLFFALVNLILISHNYSYADVHHREALFAIFLTLLALSPAGESLSVDSLIRRRRERWVSGSMGVAGRADTAMWPLKLTHVLLAMTYFSTGITKLLSGGLRWINGYTLQIDLFSDAMARNRPLGIWLAGHHTLCVLLSVATILFELFFFVSLLLPRAAPFFFLSGMLFHTGLFITAGHPFFEHIFLNGLLLLFLDPEWFQTWLHKLDSRLSQWRGDGRAHQPS